MADFNLSGPGWPSWGQEARLFSSMLPVSQVTGPGKVPVTMVRASER